MQSRAQNTRGKPNQTVTMVAIMFAVIAISQHANISKLELKYSATNGDILRVGILWTFSHNPNHFDLMVLIQEKLRIIYTKQAVLEAFQPKP